MNVFCGPRQSYSCCLSVCSFISTNPGKSLLLIESIFLILEWLQWHQQPGLNKLHVIHWQKSIGENIRSWWLYLWPNDRNNCTLRRSTSSQKRLKSIINSKVIPCSNFEGFEYYTLSQKSNFHPKSHKLEFSWKMNFCAEKWNFGTVCKVLDFLTSTFFSRC